MATLMPNGKQRYSTPTGAPLVGGQLYTYAQGTSALKATFADVEGLEPNTNPVILDANGEATIFWEGAYKVVLKDAAGNLQWTVDGVVSADSYARDADASLRADLASGTNAAKGAALMAFNAALSYPDGSVGAALSGGVLGDGVTDNSAAVAAANARGRPILFVGVSVIGTPTTITVPIVDTLAQIFSADSKVTINNGLPVRPEWFGLTQGSIRRAVDALPAGGGTVQLEARTYPPNGFVYGFGSPGVCIGKDNVKIQGRKMPRLADDCKSLIGGTVIQGMVSAFANNIEISDLGVDNGYTVGQSTFGGTPPAGAADALVLTYPDDATKGASAVRKTARLHNVVGLAYGPSAPAHAVLIGEGYVNISCTGEIVACYGSHGAVIKCASVRAEQITAYCNAGDGLIIKSDAQASATATDIQIGRVHVDAMGPRGHTPYAIAMTGYGVLFQADGGPVSRVQIGEIQAYDYPVGVGVGFGGAYSIDDVAIGRIVTDQGTPSGTRQGIQLLAAAAQNIARWHIGSLHARNTTVGLQASFSQIAGLPNHLEVGELNVVNSTTAAEIGGSSYVGIGTVTAANCSDAIFRVTGTPRLSLGMVFKGTDTPNTFSALSGGLAPSLTNGWTQISPSANDVFGVDLAGGRIYLRGFVKPGTSNILSVLPLWARPVTNKRFMVQGYNGSATVAVPLVVDADGNVKVNEVAGGTANCTNWLSLSGVTYDQQV